MSINLTQEEADRLLAMEKYRTSDERVRLPDMGGGVVVPLMSSDGAENFHLDISRSRINLCKGKFQSRARTAIVLARVDIAGAPHRNPDEAEVACPHIHLFREGFGDRWAFPLPRDKFTDPESHWQTLLEFLAFCNIIRAPEFEKGLFT